MRRLIVIAVALMCLSGCKRSLFSTPRPPYDPGPRNEKFADQASDITPPDMSLRKPGQSR